MIEKYCIKCNKKFEVKAYRVKKGHALYCSTYCRNSGSGNPRWKGGITPINKKIRDSIEYEEWRTKVFIRDNYTCQGCGQIGGYLEADHIKSFSLYPELRFDTNNGRTFCKSCHRKTNTWGSQSRISYLLKDRRLD